jgi:2,3-bisphosphoglycerate-independent phosphoglycerate mutase
MKQIKLGGDSVADQFSAYAQHRDQYDYFFIHVKGTDMAGEDGDFNKKVAVIEEVDRALPILLEKKDDVLAITGDHSTPVSIKGHSWHPQPVLLHSRYSGWDGLERFTERAGNVGSLGSFEAKYLIRLMQANAKMLDKFGA